MKPEKHFLNCIHLKNGARDILTFERDRVVKIILFGQFLTKSKPSSDSKMSHDVFIS